MAKNRRRTRKNRNEHIRRQVKRIDVLPDDVLLGIFDFYLDMNSQLGGKSGKEAWQSLVHVCRRWRSLVFQSPRRLKLRLYCTPIRPVRDTLDIWPALPLIVMGSMATGSAADNVIGALERSNRVCQVSLRYFGIRQLEEVLATMQVPFPELTIMELCSSFDEGRPVIPDSFLGGSAPRLRTFTLDCIPFPGLPKLLLSATDLVSLKLINIPHSGYISPEAIVALLCALSSLETLSLGFQPPESRPDWESRSLPPLKRSILPALHVFSFKGVTEYLEELVTHIDTPQLHTLSINFFNQTDFNCPRLAQFINRTPILRAPDELEAHVQFNDSTTSVNLQYIRSLRYRITSMSGLHWYKLEIKISCNEPDGQLSSIEQVCNSSLLPLSTFEDLYIDHLYYQLLWKNDAFENALWLELLLPFTAVKNLYLSEQFAPGIAAALQELVVGRITEVLPSLQKIVVTTLRSEASGSFQETFGQFVTARHLSGHPVSISVRNYPV